MKTRIFTTILAGMVIPLLYSQSDTGRITGTITDSTTAVIRTATVTVKNEKTGQTRRLSTNDDGIYLVTQLGPSTYTISAEATGITPAEYTGVTSRFRSDRSGR